MAKVQTAGGTPFIYIPSNVMHAAMMQKGDIWEFADATPDTIILKRNHTTISSRLREAATARGKALREKHLANTMNLGTGQATTPNSQEETQEEEGNTDATIQD